MIDESELDRQLNEVSGRDRLRAQKQLPVLWNNLKQHRRTSRSKQLFWPALAAAAALTLGIGIGRWTATTQVVVDQVATIAVDPAQSGWAPTYVDLRGRAHGLLTEVMSEAGSPDADWQPLAAELLWATRLLIDSPMGSSSEDLQLLNQLELVLAELLGIDSDAAPVELELLRESIVNNALLTTLQSVPGRSRS